MRSGTLLRVGSAITLVGKKMEAGRFVGGENGGGPSLEDVSWDGWRASHSVLLVEKFV